MLTLDRLARVALPSVPPGRFFAPSEAKTLAAAVEIFLHGAPVSIPVEDAVHNIERFLIRGQSRRAWRIRLLLTILEWTPVSLGKKPFSHLSIDERIRLFEEKFITGRGLYGICAKVKHVCLMGIYGDGRAFAAIGFVPVPRRRRYNARPTEGNDANGAL